MTILVTGATGFLGQALVNALVCQKLPVRILARDAQKARALFGEGMMVVAGDIADRERVQEAVEGISQVFHLAGRLYHPSVPTALYRETHVEGTRNLLDACLQQDTPPRMIHCSTTGVFGVTGATPAGEHAPAAPTNPYEATKREGELLAMGAFREHGLPVSVIRPGLVYGPGDLHLLGLFTAIQRGLFRVIDGGKSLLHPVFIDDMIRAFLLCAERPEAIGRSYNIAGEHPVSMRKLTETIAQALDKELAGGSIPLWLAYLAADIFAVTPGLKGERAPLTRSRVHFLSSSRVYDCSRARTELGFTPQVDVAEGMKRTAHWYREHHYV